jgi:hypothetical protein
LYVLGFVFVVVSVFFGLEVSRRAKFSENHKDLPNLARIVQIGENQEVDRAKIGEEQDDTKMLIDS